MTIVKAMECDPHEKHIPTHWYVLVSPQEPSNPLLLKPMLKKNYLANFSLASLMPNHEISSCCKVKDLA